MGKPRLSVEEKKARGTYRPAQERYYALADGRPDPTAPAPVVTVPDPAERRDYDAIAWQYATDVADGKAVACRWVKLACIRQIKDRAREREPFWPYVWSKAEAEKACHFVECCPHVEGRWATPTIRLEPWQVFLVAVLFGWRYKGDGTRRRFTQLYLEVARKSAKSTLMAAIAYYHLLKEGEPGASVICGATTGSQARMVFDIMGKMGRKSNWLRAKGVEVFANSIKAPDGSAKPINSKSTSQDGLNPSCIVLDESHAQDFGLHDVLKSAQGARPNPLMLCPTTAGYNLLSVGYALRTQACKVLDEVYEADHLLGIVYTLDDDDDWTDPAAWAKANPMLGISPTIEFVTKYCADAQQAPGLEGEFKVKVCSLWAQASGAWLSMTAWDRCADDKLRLEDFLGQECWMGLDLAETDDLAAKALVFRRELPRQDQPARPEPTAIEAAAALAAGAAGRPVEPQRAFELVAFVTCYLPADVVEERARRVPAYREWARAGLLVMTEGTMTDYARIEADAEADALRFKVREAVFDQHGSAQSAARLAAKGIPAVVEPKNARTATPPARELEARVKHRLFRHDGNSLLKWAASNTVVSRRVDGSILPKKENAESPNKIDPIDAILSAVGGLLRGAAHREPEYQVVIIGGKKA